MKSIVFAGFLTLSLAFTACGSKGSSHDTTGSSDDGGDTLVAAPQLKNGEKAPKPLCDKDQQDGIIGTYNGYVKTDDNKKIPLSLYVESKQGSSGSGSGLRASMRIGLFGGVMVGADDASSDALGNFTATFQNTGFSLELQGQAQCGTFTSVLLIGRKTYTNIVLSSSAPSLFTPRQEFPYKMTFVTRNEKGDYIARPKAATVDVTFNNRLQPVPSNLSSDVPSLPNLQTSVIIDNLPAAPSTADTTIYQTLEGQMQFHFTGYGTANFKSVGISDDKNPEFPILIGDYSVDSAFASYIKLTPFTDDELKERAQHVMDSPASYFTGSYTGTNGISSPVRANLINEHMTNKNPAGSLFPDYPKMSLEITLCGNASTKQNMELASIDPLTSKASFVTQGGSYVYKYEAVFSSGLDHMDGSITKNAGKGGLHLYLKTSGSNPVACSN